MTVFLALDKLMSLHITAENEIWMDIDLLVVRCVPVVSTVEEVADDPVEKNMIIGTYTNLSNVMELSSERDT